MLNGANLIIQSSSPHRGFTPVSDTHHWAAWHILRPPFPHPHSPVCCFLFQSISQIPTRCSSFASIQMLRCPTGQLHSQLRGLSPLSPTSHSPCQRVTSPRRALPGGFHWLWHQAHVFWGVFQGSTILGGWTDKLDSQTHTCSLSSGSHQAAFLGVLSVPHSSFPILSFLKAQLKPHLFPEELVTTPGLSPLNSWYLMVLIKAHLLSLAGPHCLPDKPRPALPAAPHRATSVLPEHW